jgi:hypothetical protein
MARWYMSAIGFERCASTETMSNGVQSTRSSQIDAYVTGPPNRSRRSGENGRRVTPSKLKPQS